MEERERKEMISEEDESWRQFLEDSFFYSLFTICTLRSFLFDV
jgi:hypothetical protein